jgi:hypothetical protein
MLLVLISTKNHVAALIFSYGTKFRAVAVFCMELTSLLPAKSNKKGPQSGPFLERKAPSPAT